MTWVSYKYSFGWWGRLSGTHIIQTLIRLKNHVENAAVEH